MWNTNADTDDKFFCVKPLPECGVESVNYYSRPGFHPVILGDILPKPGTCADPDMKPRYQIYQKLGHGGMGSVWLARDLVVKRWVAIKVCSATEPKKPTEGTPPDSTESQCSKSDATLPRNITPSNGDYTQQYPSNEVRILTHLRQLRESGTVCKENDGHQYIVDMYDSFVIRGPNGSHECLVTEIVMPLTTRAFDYPQFHPMWKVASQQILAGFAFLHRQGIVHGDPTYANLGIRIPQLQDVGELEMFDTLEQTMLYPVFTREAPEGSLPAYLSPIFSLQEFLTKRGSMPQPESCDIKILDFGLAFWADPPAKEFVGCTPSAYRPPEVCFYHKSNGDVGTGWSKEADIWAVASLLSQMHGEYVTYDEHDDAEALLACCRLGGKPLEEWLKYLDVEATRVLPADGVEPVSRNWDTNEAWAAMKYKHVPDREIFIDLMRRMIRTDPQARTPLHRLLDHPYFGSVCRGGGHLTPPAE